MLILWLWLDQPVWAAAVQQLEIGSAQRFSSPRNRWLRGLKSILTPAYLPRARNIAAEMIPPHESASTAADLAEYTARAEAVV